MSDVFVREFRDVTVGIRQAELARAMADVGGGNPRSLVGSLSRMRRGNQVPKTEMIDHIAAAIGSLKDLSRQEVDSVRERLAYAAHPEDWRSSAELDLSETEHRRRLHPLCKQILKKVKGLSEQRIDQILQHIGVSTMKLIIAADKRGEEIEVVALQELSAAFPQSEEAVVATVEEEKDKTVVDAGRAQIIVDGDITASQLKVLQSAAEMIEAVLRI